jgi:hypothetical protein
MRVLRTPLVDAYHERVAEIPKDTSGEPTCARLPFCGQTLEMHRFDAFVPAEGTTGDPQEMPLLAGEGVGLVREIEPAGTWCARWRDRRSRCWRAYRRREADRGANARGAGRHRALSTELLAGADDRSTRSPRATDRIRWILLKNAVRASRLGARRLNGVAYAFLRIRPRGFT